MGFKISWLALKGVQKADALARVGFKDTGIEDEVNETPFSAAQLPSGWSVIWANDPEWASPKFAEILSVSGPVLWVRLHEGVMWSECSWCENGRTVWRVANEGQQKGLHLESTGSPPGLDEIVAGLRSQQIAEGEDESEVDFAFDVPIMVAARLTGWTYDKWELADGGRPYWTSVDVTR